MPSDQAAGLRRRRAAQPALFVSCHLDSPSVSVRLAQALRRHGSTVLLVDLLGRQFADAPTRSLFDWPHQLARKQLNTLPQPYGDGWLAAGLRLDAPDLCGALAGYDCVVFDAGPLRDEVSLPSGARHACLIAVEADSASQEQAYRLLKTVSRTDNSTTVLLLGEAENCVTVLAACRRFLEQGFIKRVNRLADEDDAFDRLAGRMAHEETHRTMRSE